MKLNETLVIKLPYTGTTPPTIREHTVTDITVVGVMDDFVHKQVRARLDKCPFPVLLWDKDEYDAAQWTNESAQARAEELVPNAAALKALIPKVFAEYNP